MRLSQMKPNRFSTTMCMTLVGGLTCTFTSYAAPPTPTAIPIIYPSAGCSAAPAHRDPTLVTNSWNGYLPYGGYSATVSSRLMQEEFPSLIPMLNSKTASINQLKQLTTSFRCRFMNLRDFEIRGLVHRSKAGQSLTIYEENQSYISTDKANYAFIKAMKNNPLLSPFDFRPKSKSSYSKYFQFNTHRGLHSNASLIPPNSLAAAINAYVSGIRSIEIDVLETCAPAASMGDNCKRIPVVIHDLTTNRITGEYSKEYGKTKLQYVGNLKIDQIEDKIRINILNPIYPGPSSQSTPIRGLMAVEDFLSRLNTLAPGMKIFLDARNSSPASLIYMMYQYKNTHLSDPDFISNNVVIKVYPFEYGNGADSLISDLATIIRNNEGTSDNTYKKAIDIIKYVNPSILLALGEVGEQSTVAFNNNDKDWTSFNNFLQNSGAPFLKKNYNSDYNIVVQEVFSESDLSEIEKKSWLGFAWMRSFFPLFKVEVFQFGMLPSITYFRNHITETYTFFQKIPLKDKKSSAIAQNILTAINSILLNCGTCYGPFPDDSQDIRSWISSASIGSADRYPDYGILFINKEIDKVDNKGYYFNMFGYGEIKDDVGSVSAMRSTKFFTWRVSDIKTFSMLNFNYVTTDLPIDTRAALMKITGDNEIPDDIKIRPNSVVKRRYLGPGDYEIPYWLQKPSDSIDFYD